MDRGNSVRTNLKIQKVLSCLLRIYFKSTLNIITFCALYYISNVISPMMIHIMSIIGFWFSFIPTAFHEMKIPPVNIGTFVLFPGEGSRYMNKFEGGQNTVL